MMRGDVSSEPKETPPASRAEVRLRGQVAELEARLVEVTGCLEEAENRASELLALRERAKDLESRLEASAESRASEMRAMGERVNDLEAQLAGLQHKYAVVTTSRSWQMTGPLRRAMSRVRGPLGP